MCSLIYIYHPILLSVSPIEEHGSAACFGTIHAYMNHVTTLPARSESVATLFSLWLWCYTFNIKEHVMSA